MGDVVKVLIIEDSAKLRRSLVRGLAKSGYVVDAAEDGTTGFWLARTCEYDVIVLDLMLPGLSGLDVLRRLRQAGRASHVLILSAKDRVEDRVKGLELGADDYLVKPFSFDELCARLQALVRRAYGLKSPRLRVGDLEIDLVGRRVFRDDTPLALSPKEYLLLEYLAYRRGRPSSQNDIVEHLHERDKDVLPNAAEVLVSSLRRRIHRPDTPSIIKTRRGFGYVIDAEDVGEVPKAEAGGRGY